MAMALASGVVTVAPTTGGGDEPDAAGTPAVHVRGGARERSDTYQALRTAAAVGAAACLTVAAARRRAAADPTLIRPTEEQP